MKVALIATGNEVVSGQIVNTNGAKLAALLEEQGAQVAYQLALPDKKASLVSALNFLTSEGVSQVFVIGGLGPTRDDLTRYVIAEHMNLEMTFEPSLWEELSRGLSSRGIEPREGHKQQCYFPQMSHIIENSIGTAQGFFVETKKLSVWCLPGPPNEMLSVYKNGIEPYLKKEVSKNFELITWQCIDIPESDLAHKVEEALKGCTYEVGYRANPPLVELKLWVPADDTKDNIWEQALDKLLQDHLYSKNGAFYFKDFFHLFKESSSLSVRDDFSSGFVFELFSSYSKNFKTWSFTEQSEALPPKPDSRQSYIWFSYSDEGAFLETHEKKVFYKVSVEKLLKSKWGKRRAVAHLIKSYLEA